MLAPGSSSPRQQSASDRPLASRGPWRIPRFEDRRQPCVILKDEFGSADGSTLDATVFGLTFASATIQLSVKQSLFAPHVVLVDEAGQLPLPYAGVFLRNGIGSPGGDMPKGLHLYSAATRNMSSNLAVIRGELLQHDNREPAAHALLMVQDESGESWYGIADAQGFYSIVFPYPDLQEGFAGSPSDGSSGAFSEQSWQLELSVFYSPSSQQSLPGTDIPNYLSILHQQAAEIWPQASSEDGSGVIQFPVSLMYHQPAVTKTDGLSELLVSPLP